MGVERAVTRWYVKRQAFIDEIASLEAKLAKLSAETQEPRPVGQLEIEKQLAEVQSKLRALGPCPKPMMG